MEGLDDERAAPMLYVVITLRLKSFDAAGAAALAPRLEAAAREAGPWWKPRTLAGAAAAYLHAGHREQALELFRELADFGMGCQPGSRSTTSLWSGTTWSSAHHSTRPCARGARRETRVRSG